MTLPDLADVYAAIAVTWPAARTAQVGPWTIREGKGGGSRVSAATVTGDWTLADLPRAEEAMQALGQTPLFMLRAGDEALDAALAARGYVIKDPVQIYAAPVDHLLTDPIPPVSAFTVWPPLAAQAEIWAAGGVGPSRLAVMDRAPFPKTTLLGRRNDQVAGTVYLGSHAGMAMLHALEIAKPHRRQGLGAIMTQAAARWAQRQGLAWLTLITTDANGAANALYSSLGMDVVGQYHYRIMPDKEASV